MADTINPQFKKILSTLGLTGQEAALAQKKMSANDVSIAFDWINNSRKYGGKTALDSKTLEGLEAQMEAAAEAKKLSWNDFFERFAKEVVNSEGQSASSPEKSIAGELADYIVDGVPPLPPGSTNQYSHKIAVINHKGVKDAFEKLITGIDPNTPQKYRKPPAIPQSYEAQGIPNAQEITFRDALGGTEVNLEVLSDREPSLYSAGAAKPKGGIAI